MFLNILFFYLFYFVVFENSVLQIVSIYASTTITGVTSAKSQFMWTCSALPGSTFSLFCSACYTTLARTVFAGWADLPLRAGGQTTTPSASARMGAALDNREREARTDQRRARDLCRHLAEEGKDAAAAAVSARDEEWLAGHGRRWVVCDGIGRTSTCSRSYSGDA